MEIDIKKLAPELAEDYLKFFDDTPHDDGIDEHKCYCICWSSADHELEKPDFSTVQKRREIAGQYVRDGKLQGYLTYLDGRPVGWCNANTRADCRRCESWLRSMQEVPEDGSKVKVKSIFCFVITPELWRKGMATKLLERVCEDARAEGFDMVESYPRRSFVDPAQDYMGLAAMYEKAGFEVVQEIKGGKVIMRKRLQAPR